MYNLQILYFIFYKNFYYILQLNVIIIYLLILKKKQIFKTFKRN